MCKVRNNVLKVVNGPSLCWHLARFIQSQLDVYWQKLLINTPLQIDIERQQFHTKSCCLLLCVSNWKLRPTFRCLICIIVDEDINNRRDTLKTRTLSTDGKRDFGLQPKWLELVWYWRSGYCESRKWWSVTEISIFDLCAINVTTTQQRTLANSLFVQLVALNNLCFLCAVLVLLFLFLFFYIIQLNSHLYRHFNEKKNTNNRKKSTVSNSHYNTSHSNPIISIINHHKIWKITSHNYLYKICKEKRNTHTHQTSQKYHSNKVWSVSGEIVRESIVW